MQRTTYAYKTAFLTVMVMGISSAYAQGPHVGIKLGANLSNLYNGEVTDNNARFGFNAGVFARSTTDQPIGVQAELLYTTKGTETEYHGFFGLVDQTVNFKMNYLELPVMLSVRFLDGAVELQGGAYASYLLSANVSTNGDLGNGSDTIDKDNFKSIDAGIVGGIAFNLGAAQVGLRYDYGLNSIADSDAAKTLLGDAKNSCAQLYIGIGMP